MSRPPLPSPPQLFDPDRLTATGKNADCPVCQGTGKRFVVQALQWVICRNCNGTGRAVIPY